MSTASTIPRSSTSAHTIHGTITPLAVSANMPSAGTAMSACVTERMRRLESRSASTPPQAPTSRMGRNWSAAVRPTAAPEPVSFRMSHVSATICIQLPATDTA